MITNIDTGPQTVALLEPIREVVDSSLGFYLTGSRLFGGPRVDSDWDFFIQDTEEVRLWLHQGGFVPEGISHRMNSYPDDPSIANVYFKGNLQVQLVRNAELKNKAQLLLLSLPYSAGFRTAAKHLRRGWWQWAFRIADSQAYPMG